MYRLKLIIAVVNWGIKIVLNSIVKTILLQLSMKMSDFFKLNLLKSLLNSRMGEYYWCYYYVKKSDNRY